MENKKRHLENFIIFGTFSAPEADMLRPELEKKGVPVKVLYPGTNVGPEATAQAGWTAYTIMIRERDIKPALDVCKTLNIKAGHKIPLSRILYTRLNRCISAVLVALWLLLIILGSSGKLQDEALVGAVIGMLFLTVLPFIVSTSYKIIRRNRKL